MDPTGKAANRKLVVSFTGLVLHIVYDNLRIEDLDHNTLYYFGCTRDLVLDALRVDPEYVEGYCTSEEEKARRRETYKQLQPVLIKANMEFRLYARDLIQDMNSYEGLNWLLSLHGISPLKLDSIDDCHWYHYNLQTVKRLVTQSGIPLKVIGN